MRRFVCISLLFLLAATAYADTNVQGTISSTTWTSANSPYRVKGALLVPAGNMLTIEAGVDVLFDANVPIVVEGNIRAAGTEANRIRFLGGAAEHWGGIDLRVRLGDIDLLGGDSSAFAYTQISDGTGGGAGGLSASHQRVAVLVDCIISGNHSSSYDGSGAIEGSFEATRCVFENNSSRSGDAVGGMGTFTDCVFRGNTVPYGSYGSLISVHGEVHAERAPPPRLDPEGFFDQFVDDRPIVKTTFDRCRFIDNVTGLAPIMARGDSLCQVTITSCSFSGNRSQYGNSAIWAEGDYRHGNFPKTRRRPVLKIENTVISGNRGRWAVAVGVTDGDVTIINSTIADNGWAPLPDYPNNGPPPSQAVGIQGISRATIVNSILWGNGGPESFETNTSVRYSSVMGGWAGEGNIDLDPLFVDPGSGNYALQLGSPCIGAAEILGPAYPWQDMGAAEVDWIIPVEWPDEPETPKDAAERPVVFALERSAPNPFNPSTAIAYSVAAEAPVSIVIYDQRGAIVRTLVDALRAPGYYRATWNGRDAHGREVGTGVYVVRFTAGQTVETKRLTLLR
jgi:hypothetical protein